MKALIITLVCIIILPLFPQVSFFDAYRPNYFAVSWEEEEPHIEFLLSIRYPRILKTSGERHTHEFFGTYSGLYDFYLYSRYSSPVVSRMQNVGFNYRLNFKPKDKKWSGHLFGVDRLMLRYLEFSISHESNGQSIESEEEYLPYLSHEDKEIRENADDYVSMSTNYLGVEIHMRYNYSDHHHFYAYLAARPLMVTPGDKVYSKKEFKGTMYQYKLFRITLGHEYGVQSSRDKKEPVRFWDISVYRYALVFKWQFINFFRVPLILMAGTDNPNEISSWHQQDPFITIGFGLR